VVAGSSNGPLILTVTRQCDLRCSYCPTVKDGWPSLSIADGRGAVRLFADQYGGGDIKLFGGEPLLVPDVIRAVFEEARDRPEIRWVYLSTNGLGLTEEWLSFLADYPKAILTVSLDGRPQDNRRFRKTAKAGVPDAYDHVMSLRKALLKTPRVVITQTIPPAAAEQAVENFQHLLDLGFWRFNLLPGYYLPWRESQLNALRKSFSDIASLMESRWAAGTRFYLRNLFTWAPTPFFNTGLVVDSDRTIHPSNVGLSGQLDGLRGRTQVGDLDNPPSLARLSARAEEVEGFLKEELSAHVWASTQAVDAALSELCERLYPAFVAYKKRRGAA
jgi:uncharacterized Fe-S cluster-containing radical SAM superfamily protein